MNSLVDTAAATDDEISGIVIVITCKVLVANEVVIKECTLYCCTVCCHISTTVDESLQIDEHHHSLQLAYR